MTFCRSCEYELVPVKLLVLEVLELLLELVADDTGGVVTDDEELNALLTVLINNSRAGQDEKSYPAREG
jgi:hypothetical protein